MNFRTKNRHPGPLAWALLATLLFAPGAIDALQAAENPDEPIAMVGKEPVLRAELEAAVAAELRQIDQRVARERAALLQSRLEEVVDSRTLAVEAAAQGITVEQLMTQMAPAPVTDADVDAFYEENKSRIPPTTTKEQVGPQIRTYLEQGRTQTARQEFLAALRTKHAVKILLGPPRVEVAATGPSRGPASAPVTLIEFSDFQCPFCARINPSLEQVLAKYGDKVRLVFRQFPLGFHANAQKAAEASLCAEQQGRFWQLHDAMFKNQGELAVEQLKAKAAGLGMDATTFGRCLDEGRFAAAVQADLEDGQAAGVEGTPALFVNGRFINGAVPFEDIAKVIDDELARLKTQ